MLKKTHGNPAVPALTLTPPEVQLCTGSLGEDCISKALSRFDTTPPRSLAPLYADSKKYTYITRRAAPALLRELPVAGEAHSRLEAALRDVLTSGITFEAKTQLATDSVRAKAAEKMKETQTELRKAMNQAARTITAWTWLDEPDAICITLEGRTLTLQELLGDEPEDSGAKIQLPKGAIPLMSGGGGDPCPSVTESESGLVRFYRPPENWEHSDELWHDDELEERGHSKASSQSRWHSMEGPRSEFDDMDPDSAKMLSLSRGPW